MGWIEKRSHRLKKIAHRRARRQKNRDDFHVNDYKAIRHRVWDWYFY